MRNRRRFGSIRKRESGRFQVRYPGPDGLLRNAPHTFARKSEAERYLALVEAQLMKGEWADPDRGKVTVQDYAERWIAQRPGMRPRTVDLYKWLLRKHIRPHIGALAISKLDAPTVRAWRAGLLSSGVSQSVTAKSYRLLRAVLMTAVKEDEMIRTNPCRIPGADQEKPDERPVLTVAQVFALADQVPDRYRAMILVATFGCLRWGEIAGLRREDIDTDTGTVRVRQALIERDGKLTLGPPKSRAASRTVAIPASILPAVLHHIDRYVAKGPESFVFTGPKGGLLRRSNFRSLVDWSDAVAAIGKPGLHFHDLRHTGNTLAARTRASLRDLMTRMGHDSPRAALIYQHASEEADRAIADAVNQAISSQHPNTSTDQDEDPDDGAAGALVPVA
jgi:integrase